MSDVVEDPYPDRKKWSFSSLSTYAQCSEMYRLEKVVRPRVPQRPALWNTLGTGIHYALEQWINSARTSDMHADFEIGYEAEWDKQVIVQPDFSLWNNPYKGSVLLAKETCRGKGHEQIEAFLTWLEDPEHDIFPLIDPEEGVAWTEVGFQLPLGENILVRGSIDLVEEGQATDWKSGAAKGSKPLQLGIYTLALKKLYGMENSTGQFFYTKVDARSKFGRSQHYDMTRYTEEYVTDVFEAAQRGVDAEVFIPNPSDFCDSLCSVKSFCREKGESPIPLNWQDIPEDEIWWAKIQIDAPNE